MDEITQLQNRHKYFTDALKKLERIKKKTPGTGFAKMKCREKIAEMFVLGCTVDYVREFGGSYLKVINPNAKAQCGCGESFAI